VNSAHSLVKNFGFDGLDLAWEFPETKPKKIRGKISKVKEDWFVIGATKKFQVLSSVI
jgi:GH18 family chitinase